MKTISEEYRKQQQELHKNPNYGVASLGFSPIVASIIKQLEIKSLSDYGAGKKRLLEGLNANHVIPEFYYPYDPAFPEYGKPQKAELVCCIDVLEHIEPEMIDNVIKELSLLVTDWGFFTIHQGPAAKFLSDGRNAHLIQESTSWWLKKLIKYFDIFKLQKNTIGGTGFFVIVKPLIS